MHSLIKVNPINIVKYLKGGVSFLNFTPPNKVIINSKDKYIITLVLIV